MKASNSEGGSQPISSNTNSIEPIAIVGFGFKFPQDVTNAESLWKLLIERRSTMTEIPKNRWNIDGFYKENGHRPGTVKNRGGHFLADDPARFDAPFFSIQPAEAECMDPQQRLLLETSYHALENAGITMQAAVGTRTSVHVGCLLQEYNQITQRDAQMPGDYRIVGSSGLAMLSNRLSWFYDFSGPSMTVDTACSGGLVALHLACQELLVGDVNMSLVCGSNLCLLPDSTALLSSLNMMSKDSVCYSFDERASGYARGEGFGVLILKRLSEAIADGNMIRGVIRSTGCGQDGNTPSITSPSQTAQERLIRETYARAGLSLDETRYFEAHGTGTPVGDPCEAAAINSVFSARTLEEPMFVGAIKSNMGHPEGASGIAGVIKTLLVLEKGIIPPNVYPERINPAVTAAGPNLKFPLEPTMWPTSGLRRASVNSFGYGGTNAHVVIDDALHFLRQQGLEGRHCTDDISRIEKVKHDDYGQTLTLSESSTGDRSEIAPSDHTPSGSVHDFDEINILASEDSKLNSKLLVVSAFDERAVHRSIDALRKWMFGHLNNENRDQSLNDLAYTLAEKRTKFSWKSVCVASSDPQAELTWSPPMRSKQNSKICFVFTGQGAQWHGMGRELMRYDIFSRRMREADEYLRSLGSSWSLLDELYVKSEHESTIHRPEMSQPICTALQVALLDLLASWNIHASLSVGHSSGEIAAAYASRAISRESAWMIAYFRGLAVGITQTLSPSDGAMVAVQAPIDSWKHLLDNQNHVYPDNPVVIACYNSLHSFTLSGPRDAIHQLVSKLREANIEVHVLKVDVAYHSLYMKLVAEIYYKLLQNIEPGDLFENSQPSFTSTVTGRALEDNAELRNAAYWNRNLTGSVRFSVALEEICARPDASSYCFVEVGPHSVLRSPLSDILKTAGRDVASDYASVLRRGYAADITAMQCAGKLYALGVPIDLSAINNNAGSTTNIKPNMLTSLPSYPFEDKKRYWLEGRTSIQYRQTKFVHHELLGSRTPDWNPYEARWTNRILLDQSPYLKDHQINGLCLMPAAGMLVMAVEAVRQFYSDTAAATNASGYKMRDVAFTKAMTLSGDPRGTEIQLTLRPASVDSRDAKPGSAWNHFSLYVYENEAWHLCCSGSIAITYDETSKSVAEEQNEKARNVFTAAEQCRMDISSADVYNAFDKAGLCYGPTFRGMQAVKWNEQRQQAVASIGLREWQKHAKFPYTDAHLVHPAALDAILQVTFPAYSIFAKSASATTVPTGFNNAWFSANLMHASDEAKSVKVQAQVMGCGFRNKLFSVSAAGEQDERLCFCGELETSTIGRSGAAADDEGQATNTLYRIDWQPADFSGLDLDNKTALDPAGSKVYMVYDDSDDLQRHFADALREVALTEFGLEMASISWMCVSEQDLSKATCVFLLGLDGKFLRLMQQEDLAKIKQLLSTVSRLIWPSLQHTILEQSPTEGLVSGLVRTLATESEDYHLISVCLDETNGFGNLASNLSKVIKAKLMEHTGDPEDEYWEIDRVLCTPRVVDDPDLVAQVLPPSEEATTVVSKPWNELESPMLTIGAAGILKTLHYEQAPVEHGTLESDEHVLVQVKAVGLNARDIQVALGQVHDDALGSEIAGVVLEVGASCTSHFQVGDRVFGIARNGVAQTAQIRFSQLQRIPWNTSFTQSVTYPVAYCTAYYGLEQIARVTGSDKVLIHDAASALGQIGIQICQVQRCTLILLTVTSIEQMDFVHNTFGIPKSQIFLTGEPGLEHSVQRLTGQQGVDIIMGSTEAIQDSCSCIASFGRIVDVSEKHTFVSTANQLKGTSLPIAAMATKNFTFTNINFQELEKSHMFQEILKTASQLISIDEIVPPKPVTIYKQSEVEQAFRALQDEKLAGKIVIEIDNDEVVDMEVSPHAVKHLFHENASYLVAGAFGGIGQSIVQWMVQQGAKYLILPSRSPIEGTGSGRERFVHELQAQGAVVQAPVCDIANKDQLKSALDSLNDFPDIKGCIQAAMVMRDASFANMSIEKWHQSLAPKVEGSWNLHQLLPENLDFFVMLSSSTGIMGSFGQSNYTAGNTYQDALAAHRMRHRQRAHTLVLSMVTGVGFVAQNEQVQALLRVRGMLEEVSMQDIFDLLRFCCDPSRVDASTVGSQIITPLTLPADLRAMGIVAPLGSTRPIYHYLDTLPARKASAADADKLRPSHLLAEAKSLAHATDIIVGAIQSQLSSLLVVSKEDIDPQKAIYRYGVDSLVAVEMRNWFSKAVGADVSTADIMSDISIWLLAVKVAGASRFVSEELKE